LIDGEWLFGKTIPRMKDSANASELDLGVMPNENIEPCCAPKSVKGEEKKPSYPSVRFSDEQVDRFVEKFGQPEMDEEWTVTVKLRVNGFTNQKYDKSISLDMLSIIGDAVEEEGEADDGGMEGDTEGEMMSKQDMVKRMKKGK